MSISKRNLRIYVYDLKTIRDISKMDSARFTMPWAYMPSDAYTDEIRRATRIWRDSWITGPLNEVIEELEKELAK